MVRRMHYLIGGHTTLDKKGTSMSKEAPDLKQILKLKHTFNPPLSIIPLKIKDKKPARTWKRVFEDGNLFSDDELTQFWDSRYHNPGIATGRFSGPGIGVIDADNAQAMAWVEANVPSTDMRTMRTTDRCHYFYPLNPDVPEPKTRSDVLGSKDRWIWEAETKLGLQMIVNSKKDQTPDALAAEVELVARNREIAKERLEIGPIIDVRGYGGQVVAPGAIHKSGDIYKMVTPWHAKILDGVEPFDEGWFTKWENPDRRGPRTLKELASKRVEKEMEVARDTSSPDMRLKRGRAWMEKVEGAVSGAGGHNKTFYVANRLVVGFMIDEDQAFTMMLEDYNPRCQPPWTEEELAHKIVGASDNKGQNLGFMLVDRSRQKVFDIKTRAADDDDFVGFDIVPGPPSTGDPPPPDGGGSGDDLPPPGGDDRGLTDDEQVFIKRWAQYGVDYMELRRDKVLWTPIQKEGTWHVPSHFINLVAAIQYSRHLRGDLRWNELKLVPELNGLRLDDNEILKIKKLLDYLWGGQVPKLTVEDAVHMAANERGYDPPKEWLLGLEPWDGVERLTKVPARVMNAGPESVLGTMFRHFMTGLVARIMEPGTKVDTILFLVSSDQGAFKSQFFKRLIDGNLKPMGWFTDNPFSLRDKDGKMLIGTNILVEWSESEHAKHAKMIDTVKSFLSTQEDEFRAPYGRHMIKRPRRCVFCGTSNDKELLHDPTGSRRFYVIKIPDGQHIDLKALASWRTQLFAEALDIWKRHVAAEEDSAEWEATRWWFTAQEDKARQTSVKQFESRSAWHDDIVNWIETRRQDPKTQLFTVDEVAEDCIDVDRDKKTKKLVEEIAKTLRQIGCRYHGQKMINGRRGRFWAPPAADVAKDDVVW